MLPPLKPGVTLVEPSGPEIETERLKLRQWCSADIAPNAAMLADLAPRDSSPPMASPPPPSWRDSATRL